MNGALSLLRTLRASGVDTVFANPGTSEMHFVAALDDAPEVRGILCLFEGVATGAADGFARVSGRPAATLLHLGPGLGNGFANLHNARRARTPVVNVVGDHATYHVALDPPLASDIAAVAGALEGWVGRADTPDEVAERTREALAAAYGPPGRVATLVLPADASWGELTREPDLTPVAANRPRPVDPSRVDEAARALRQGRAALLLGGDATRSPSLLAAERIARATGARVIVETFPAVMDRGRGVPQPERLIYLVEFAQSQVQDLDHLILVGADDPVGFFAYPGVPGRVTAPTTTVITLAAPGDDARGALEALVESLAAPTVTVAAPEPAVAPTGALSTQTFAAAIAATLPEDAVVVDESNTGGLHLYGATRASAPHRLLTLTGGAIGFGVPAAVGAALAHRGRVVALVADGSLLYTVQALWTMAREGLDVTVVGLSNRAYAILELERSRVGVGGPVGEASRRLLQLTDPDLDLGAIARGLGVPAVRARTADELVEALRRSYATPGPSFVEAMLPPGLS